MLETFRNWIPKEISKSHLKGVKCLPKKTFWTPKNTFWKIF